MEVLIMVYLLCIMASSFLLPIFLFFGWFGKSKSDDYSTCKHKNSHIDTTEYRIWNEKKKGWEDRKAHIRVCNNCGYFWFI